MPSISPAMSDPENPRLTAPAGKPVVYSAPRRFDLATMITVTTVYAMMFALIRSLNDNAFLLLWIGAFVTLVGVGQAVMFGGTMPRTASAIAGALLMSAVFCWDEKLTVFTLLGGCINGTMVGVPLGYLTGTLIGGVFLVADVIRNRLDRYVSRSK